MVSEVDKIGGNFCKERKLEILTHKYEMSIENDQINHNMLQIKKKKIEAGWAWLSD